MLRALRLAVTLVLCVWLLGGQTGFAAASGPVESARFPKRMIWATPDSWPPFIDKDGKGLYKDILQAVFAPLGISIERETWSWKGSLTRVRTGKADVTGVIGEDPYLYVSRVPILFGREVLLMRSQPASLETFLKTARGVWLRSYITGFPEEQKARLRGEEVSSREQALSMFAAGRVDYYLDNSLQMDQTIAASSFRKTQFVRVTLFCTPAFMVFTQNARGMRLRDAFDSGLNALKEKGELKSIYVRWNVIYPDPNLAGCSDAAEKSPAETGPSKA